MANSASTTPRSQAAATPRSDSPGTWRHPRFQEIQRRKNASTFSEQHLKRAAWNGAALLVMYLLSDVFQTGIKHISSIINVNLSYAALILRLYFAVNVALCFLPLFAKPDTLTDIPLTPSQRKLLGLDLSIPSPSTPGNDYITPPKYKLSSASPRSGRSVSTPFSSSPLSNRGPSPTPFRTASRGESSYSPNGSPLFHKALGGGGQERDGASRRLTFGATGSSSPNLGRSLSLKDSSSSSSFKLRGSPSGTPSPTSRGRGANTGLNYKWLYEKGAQSPQTGRRESILA